MTDPLYPCKKIPFVSRAEARKCAAYAKSQKGGNMHVYHCGRCGFWHLTSVIAQNLKRKRAEHRKARRNEGVEQPFNENFLV